MRADLALIGFGNVGRRFARLLEERARLLRRDHDLELASSASRPDRHGAAFAAAGLDIAGDAAGARRRTAARRIDSGLAAPMPATAIARLAASSAPLRVVVETTTLDIARWPAGHRSRRGRARRRLPRRHRQQGAGGVRLSTAARPGDAEPGVSFLFEGAVMDGVPSSTSFARRCRRSRCAAFAASSTARPITS